MIKMIKIWLICVNSQLCRHKSSYLSVLKKDPVATLLKDHKRDENVML